MSKFKVGDKVRFIDAAYCSWRFGKEYVVTNVSPASGTNHSEGEAFLISVANYSAFEKRFELVEDVEARHIHYDLIIAWAKGAKLQHLTGNRQGWYDAAYPDWSRKVGEVRIKPEPTPDVVGYIRASMPIKKLSPDEADKAGLMSYCSLTKASQDNIKCIFDGETGELKSVELIS